VEKCNYNRCFQEGHCVATTGDHGMGHCQLPTKYCYNFFYKNRTQGTAKKIEIKTHSKNTNENKKTQYIVTIHYTLAAFFNT